MSKKRQPAFQVACPHCGAKLTVDAKLAAVVDHEPPPKQATVTDLVEAAKGLSEEARKREEKFLESVAAEKTRADVLARKFEEQLKKTAGKPVEKPLREFDLE